MHVSDFFFLSKSTCLLTCKSPNQCLLRNCESFFYPVVGADASKVGSRTGAEVECRHREAASLQTHHVGTAGSAVLHIAQV